ncbi:recombinase [Endomicrobiia bacterium]|nr:recombinase [Endomicrobiia bacterium]
MRYVIYARKSSESEDRQIQSIDDQVNRLKQLAVQYNLNIVKTITESKSAKTPNTREKFEEMLDLFENKKVDGILCWQINRLSRNPIDSAKIQWFLQQSIIKSIKIPEREYLPGDNALLFSIESGLANQFIVELRRNTKRGLESKLDKGWMPIKAPVGYINNKENKTIEKEPERFELVKKMWDLMLTEVYSVPQILNIANNEWGFRTKQYKRIGGGELSRSNAYRIFTNIFYAGICKYNDKQYHGSHPVMITLEEFDTVQAFLGKKGKPRPQKHNLVYNGIIKCKECGCSYTGEKKIKYVKSAKATNTYIYYRCNKKKKNINCMQVPVREEDLTKQIEAEIQKFTIIPEFKDWALEILNRENNKEIENRSQIHKTQYDTLLATQRQLDNLTKMRCKEMITDEEYTKERNLLTKQIAHLHQQLNEIDDRINNWLELTEKTFDFAQNARNAFINGGVETKKSILLAIGSSFVIDNGKLEITPNELLEPIAKGYKELEAEYFRLEPEKRLDNYEENRDLQPIRVKWGG